MIILINATVMWDSQQSALLQPVLKAYPTCHSWIIKALVSIWNLEKQWRMCFKEMEKAQQILDFVQQRPLAPTHMLSTLQAELTKLNNIYTSYRPLILAATQKWPFNWWSFNFQKTYQKKPSTFLRICTKLAHRQQQLRTSAVSRGKSTNCMPHNTHNKEL